MDLGLVGKVTGGAGRIGPVICSTFAREGAMAGVLDIAGDRAEATATQLRASGACALTLQVDVSVAAEVDAAVRS